MKYYFLLIPIVSMLAGCESSSGQVKSVETERQIRIFLDGLN